jgi:hypothetical protein
MGEVDRSRGGRPHLNTVPRRDLSIRYHR